MRAFIQRVSKARVSVDGIVAGEIAQGLVILLGVKTGDTEKELKWLAEKCVNLRIFNNDEGKFHLSLKDVNGEALIVSQFTLFADCRRGRRPGFTDAAAPAEAEQLYTQFAAEMASYGIKTETGVFAANMDVDIHNQGPVTVMIDTDEVNL